MASRYEIRLAGEGGQGLLVAGRVLAEAAALHDGKNAVQTQSYGAQQRGGPSRSEVIISDEEIDHPKVLAADLLLALTQDAFDRYCHAMAKDGIIIVDSGAVERSIEHPSYRIPLAEICREATGSDAMISIVSLGMVAEVSRQVSREAIIKALMAHVPKGTEKANQKALEVGFRIADKFHVG